MGAERLDWWEGASFMEHELKDSGKREQFDTGSMRDTREGKGRYDLVWAGIPEAIRRLAVIFEKGAEKYGEDNWKKGQPLRRYLDSALRHLAAVARGEEDEDHAAQAAWNCLCLLETLHEVRSARLPVELVDLPYPCAQEQP
jgi:dATP/dGTP diphosphohydrolase, N-terminal